MPSDADTGRGEQAACPWRAPADQATRARGFRTLQPTQWFSAHSFFDYALWLGLSVGFSKMPQDMCVYRKLFLQNVEFCMR